MDALSTESFWQELCGGATEEVDNPRHGARGKLFPVWIGTPSNWMAFLSAQYIKKI